MWKCSSLFSGLKCLYWQREWGDVPKAITEATVVVQHKPQSRPKTKAAPKAPAKKEAAPKTAASAKPKAAKKAAKKK